MSKAGVFLGIFGVAISLTVCSLLIQSGAAQEIECSGEEIYQQDESEPPRYDDEFFFATEEEGEPDGLIETVEYGEPSELEEAEEPAEIISIDETVETALSMAPEVPLPDGYSSDLTDFITPNGVTITDLDGNPITDNVFELGKDYFFWISYSERGDLQFMYSGGDGTGNLTYKLPGEIKVLAAVTNHPIFGSNDTKPIGQYDIDTAGNVSVRFFNVDESGEPTLTGENFIDYYYNAFFNLYIQAQFSAVYEDVELEFGDNAKITITVTPPKTGQAALGVTKSGTDPGASSTERINYTATITALAGELSDITFSDDAAGFGIYAPEALENVQVRIKGGPATLYPLSDIPDVPGTYFWNAGGTAFNVNFPEGLTLKEGETIVLTYTLSPRAYVAAAPHLGENSSEFHYVVAVRNTATVECKDADSGEPLSGTAVWLRYAQRTFFSKPGVVRDGQVTWTPRVGNPGVTLNGMTITDTLGDGVDFNNTTVTARLYAQNGTTILGSETFNVASGKTFSYTVPSDMGDVRFVELEYTVTITTPTALSFKNRLVIDSHQDKPGFTGEIRNISSDLRVAKTGILVGEYIEWEINFTIPGSLYGVSMWLRDSGYVDGEMHDVTVTATDSGGTRLLTPEEDYAIRMGGHPDLAGLSPLPGPSVWHFYFAPFTIRPGTTNPHETTSLSPFKEDTVLTIKYKSHLDQAVIATVAGWNGMTLREYLMADPAHIVRNSVQRHVYTNGIWDYVGAQVEIIWPIKKYDRPAVGDVLSFRVRLATPYNSGGARVTYDLGENPIFSDTFDSRLELVPNSLWIGTNIATDGNNINNRYYGLFDASCTDQAANYIKDNGDGTATLRFHFNDLMQIPTVGGGIAASFYSSRNNPAWSGPPLSVVTPAYQWWRSVPVTYSENQAVWVFYQLRVKEDVPPGEYVFKNSAAINGSYASEVSVDWGTKAVDKSMAPNGNIAEVDIVINPEGRRLGGASAPGNLIEVTDTMSDNLILYLSSIEIWTRSVPGGPETKREVTFETGEPYSYSLSPSDNRVIFFIEDETPVRIVYKALIRGAEGENVTAWNEVVVAGKYSDRVDDAFILTKTGAGGGGSMLPVTLFKRDGIDLSQHLEGAGFVLYVDLAYSGYLTVPLPDGIPRTVLIGGRTFYYIAFHTTDDNGRIIFNSNLLYPGSPQVFMLYEIMPPTGYGAPDDPYTLFALDEPSVVPADRVVEVISDNITVLNIKRPKLPETGGASRVPFIFAGLSVMLLAGWVRLKNTIVRKES